MAGSVGPSGLGGSGKKRVSQPQEPADAAGFKSHMDDQPSGKKGTIKDPWGFSSKDWQKMVQQMENVIVNQIKHESEIMKKQNEKLKRAETQGDDS